MVSVASNPQNLVNSLLEASAELVFINAQMKYRRIVTRRDFVTCVFNTSLKDSRFSGILSMMQREYGPVDRSQNISSQDRDQVISNNSYSLVSYLIFNNRRDQIKIEDAGELTRKLNKSGATGWFGHRFLTFPDVNAEYSGRDFEEGIRLREFRKEGTNYPFKVVIDLYQSRKLNSMGYFECDSQSIYKYLNSVNKIRIQIMQSNDLLFPIDEYTNKHLQEQIFLLYQLIEELLRFFENNQTLDLVYINSSAEEILKLNQDKSLFRP